jgi:hypothetical protein
MIELNGFRKKIGKLMIPQQIIRLNNIFMYLLSLYILASNVLNNDTIDRNIR